jgi:hypothetical protein
MGQKFAHIEADGFVIGFYDEELHGDSIPDGAVPIDDAHHVALLEGQSAGKRMKVDKKGLPLLVDPAPPTVDQLAASMRAQRTAALGVTDWLAVRHMDEQMAMQTTTLSPDQVKALGAYRKALRDLPSAKGFPNVELPVAPDFIGAK